MKRFVSLTAKITTFSTIIILLISLCVALIVYFISNTFFLKTATKNLRNETHLIGNNIENALIKVNNDINILLKTPPIQGIIRSMNQHGLDPENSSNLQLWKQRLNTIFTSMLEANKNYTQIRYLTATDPGQEIVRVNQTNQGIFPVPEASLQSKAHRDYYKQAITLSQGSVLFSKVNYNQEHGKVEQPLVPTLRVITPVYSTTQKIFGLLIINVNISRYLRDILLRSSDNYDVIVFDQFDDFFIFNHGSKTIRFYESNQQIKDGIFGNKNIKSASQIIPYLKSDTHRISVFQPIFSNLNKDHKVFTIIISVPKSILRKEDNGLIRDILFWVIALCLFAALIIFLFTHKNLKPLAEMAESIRATNHPNKADLELPTYLNNEVGLLARAFEEKTKLLSKLALFDSLTGLPNRKNFIDHLDEAIHHAKRSELPLNVIYMDINGFKEINDTYGHDYGDELLIQFAHALRKTTRDNDFCARLSGDEFAVIIQDISTEEQLEKILKRYENDLNTTYALKGITLNVVVSGGVAAYPINASKPEDLLKHADLAMYQSKREGKGLFHKTT